MRSIELVRGKTIVYDIDVEAPHTYIANGIHVHNKSFASSAMQYPAHNDSWFLIMKLRCQSKVLMDDFRKLLLKKRL